MCFSFGGYHFSVAAELEVLGRFDDCGIRVKCECVLALANQLACSAEFGTWQQGWQHLRSLPSVTNLAIHNLEQIEAERGLALSASRSVERTRTVA